MSDQPKKKYCPSKAQADLFACLLGAMFACAPCFLESFMNCMQGTNGSNGNGPGPYEPGDRVRCN